MYGGFPVAVNPGLVPLNLAQRGRARPHGCIATPAEVGPSDPFRMSITHNEVRAARVPRRGVVQAARIWVVVFRFLAEENGIGRTRHLVAPESSTGVAFHVPLKIHRVHETRIRERGLRGGIR